MLLAEYLKRIGYKGVSFVPINALAFLNVDPTQGKFKEMTAQGCKEIKADSTISLFEHLRNIRTPKRPLDKPLRMTI